MAKGRDRGRDAARPQEIPKAGWRDIALRVKDEITRDHVSVVAAGVAFFGLLAIFPAIAAMMSIAGLFLDPSQVQEQLASVLSILPENAASILESQASDVASSSDTSIGLTAAFGLVLTLYSASKGMTTLMEGMNIAYDEEEKRGFVMQYVTALLLTVLLIIGLILALVGTVVIPALAGRLGLPESVVTLVTYGRWLLLALFTFGGLAVLYRFGPSRSNPEWRWVSTGAVVATVIWILGSIAFSIYVQNFGSYNESYGALGGVIILLTWLWLSSFIVLLGAELNSEMEHQTERDTTTGPNEPMGERGAVKADTTGRIP
ncbi:membrane protein [Palleronia aestuarii]|uniref:Membrane protein n=1 Tax=Palleronia aestuarii TaxID=568105 RepID=A0A2W7N7W1_9RHOB|nr:YihY/virulence factor BrkB family protein [Palleronia aestuarii]PZX16221.1 membrane protein [Palleronia aestuarii]